MPHAGIRALRLLQVHKRLEDQPKWERAKGPLEAKMNITEPEAFHWTHKAAEERNLTMHEVAETRGPPIGGAE